MKQTPRMFIDDLIEFYEKQLKIKETPEHILKVEGSFLHFLDESKLFLLNGAVVDDLYHIPPFATDYEATRQLPFPNMFFEFMDPLTINTGPDYKRKLRGILFGNAQDINVQQPLNIYPSFDDEFMVYLFYQGKMTPFPDSIYFRASTLPAFQFLFGDFFCKYSPKAGLVCRGIEDSLERETEGNEQLQTANEHFQRILNLCINTVAYINARNVTITRTERETRNIERINRKRERRGKNLVRGLKPYNWVNVPPTEVTIGRGEGDASYKIDYRVWVRGHLQRYHTREGIKWNWRQAFVRGPPGTPWKETKYRVLAGMLERGPRY